MGKKDTGLSFHDFQMEINRLEAKEKRQSATLERTRRLIDSLKALQARGEPK